MSPVTAVWRNLTTNNRTAALMCSAILALGMMSGGFAVGDGLFRMKRADRFVTVRGAATRMVTANHASWEVHYSEHAYVLASAIQAVDRDTVLVQGYLKREGFTGRDIDPSSADISAAQEMVSNKPTGKTIYTVRRTVAFATDNVAGVQNVQAHKDYFAQKGLVLDSATAAYDYTLLDTIKPAMIAAATKEARRAAEQFASDSGSSVGSIKSATQGYFSVTSVDTADSSNGEAEAGGDNDNQRRSASSPNQKVRVVTSIDYYLN